ncbi:hypothetical protein [Pseudomonas mandelii]|uniref:hypothetical protein n=1 Tax=Pseudomonas mandelii TaxID=75612 RepID=UPI0020A132C0|nr:hypothetical protein [Pseudomonas mandelii]MCO8309228.1 hypothetical protein [Pseudomonas mandelii]
MKRDICAEWVEGFDALASGRRFAVEKPFDPRIGAMKGKLVIPDDFDVPLPDDMIDSFEGPQD